MGKEQITERVSSVPGVKTSNRTYTHTQMCAIKENVGFSLYILLYKKITGSPGQNLMLHPQYTPGCCHHSPGFGKWHFWSVVCKWVPQGMFAQDGRNRPALQHRPAWRTSPSAHFVKCCDFYLRDRGVSVAPWG